jgi:hypothetical protein
MVITGGHSHGKVMGLTVDYSKKDFFPGSNLSVSARETTSYNRILPITEL